MSALHDEEVAELARNSSPDLLAHLLVTERAARRDEQERHRAEVTDLRTTLDRAQRIGVHVMRLALQGRKSARITDLMEKNR